MSDSKKKRMAMLDTLAASGSPAPPPSLSASRPLRAARDAVDSHKVWDLDPHQIIDERIADRLDPADVDDLRASIEATGQTVPIWSVDTRIRQINIFLSTVADVSKRCAVLTQ